VPRKSFRCGFHYIIIIIRIKNCNYKYFYYIIISSDLFDGKFLDKDNRYGGGARALTRRGIVAPGTSLSLAHCLFLSFTLSLSQCLPTSHSLCLSLCLSFFLCLSVYLSLYYIICTHVVRYITILYGIDRCSV